MAHRKGRRKSKSAAGVHPLYISPFLGDESVPSQSGYHKKVTSAFRDMSPAATRRMAKAYVDRMGYNKITPELAEKAARRLEEGRAKIRDDDALMRYVGSGAWAMPDKQLPKYARGEPIAAKDAWRIFEATEAFEREHPATPPPLSARTLNLPTSIGACALTPIASALLMLWT